MLTIEGLFSICLGFIIALWLEKHYISRATVLPNVVAVFFLMWPNWGNIHNSIRWYVLIGLLLGVIALIMRIKKRKIPALAYDLTYPFYSGKTIMPIYTSIIIFREFLPEQLYLFSFWIVVIILIISTWYVGVVYLENSKPLKNFLR